MFHLSASCLCTCTSTCSHAFSTGPFVIRISCFLLSLLLSLSCYSLSSELIFVTFVGQRLFHPPTLPVFTLPPNFSPLSSPNFRPLSSPHASPPLYCLFIHFHPSRPLSPSADLYRQQRSMDQTSRGAVLDLQPCHHPYSWSRFNTVCVCVCSVASSITVSQLTSALRL